MPHERPPMNRKNIFQIANEIFKAMKPECDCGWWDHLIHEETVEGDHAPDCSWEQASAKAWSRATDEFRDDAGSWPDGWTCQRCSHVEMAGALPSPNPPDPNEGTVCAACDRRKGPGTP